MDPISQLSRRERQIMQVIFANDGATAKQIVEQILDAPSRTAIRTTLGILVEKGLLKHERVGREYVYTSKRSVEKASRGALQSLLSTFFGGSIENLIASHFSDPNAELDPEAIQRIKKMIEQTGKDSQDFQPERSRKKKSRSSLGNKRRSPKKRGSK